ncbi:MAG: adenosine deaminase [Alphaproteobacteria bacterium]|nr:adenosine deaminase [Alphaproteobacteria bacterium]
MTSKVNTAALPKVTLHEHIEGTVTPEMAAKLAQRHHVKLPDDFVMAEGQYDKNDFPNGRYAYDESDFGAFINTYDSVADMMRTPQDYYDVTKDYLSKNAAEGGVYAELILSPAHMAMEVNEKTGKSELSAPRYRAMMEAISKAAQEVKEETGLETRFIATGVRNMGAENVKQVAEFIRDNPHPLVTGFGIAGNERAGEFDDFADALGIAKAAGLKLALHAGEIRGPESIKDAIRLGASRIGHGVSAPQDPAVMKDLAEKNIMVEVCPTSNRILVTDLKGDLDNHPARVLYDAGIRISLNPDDAGIFGTQTGKEHRISAEKFNFTKAEMLDITLCAIENSFADVKTRKQVKENVYKQMTAEDRQELKDLASNAKNPILKQRLETRAAESEKVAKKLEIQQRRAKAISAMKATKMALLNRKSVSR